MAPWGEFSIFPLDGAETRELDILKGPFVRNGQSFPALLPAGCKDPPSIRCGHAFPEPMLVLPLSSGRLKCSFHDYGQFCLNSRGLQR